MALLRKRQKPVQEPPGDKPDSQKKRRHRLLDFFKSRRRNAGEHDESTPPQGSVPLNRNPESNHVESAEKTPLETQKTESSTGAVDDQNTAEQLPTPPPEPKEATVETISEKDLRTFFSGAPQYTVTVIRDAPEPTASCPWDTGVAVRDLSDCPPLSHPAFSSSTLRRHVPPVADVIPGEVKKPYIGYDLETVEIPSMLSAKGEEPGTIGFDHFLQLSISDNLEIDAEDLAQKNGLSEEVRNRELVHNNPEKLGIRSVDSAMIHERLVEISNLWLSLQEDASNTTILDKQSSGELYANLFGKFLTPPRFDPDAVDPTGLKVQIETLLRILKLKGIWFDLSLVEWRIRLGQVLWTAADEVPGDETPGLINPDETWSERDILLLQISLACELLLRLDAMSETSSDDAATLVTEEELLSFANLTSRKTDWDLVLARRFLENIQVTVVTPEVPKDPASTLRGFFSAVLANPEDERKVNAAPKLLLSPRHQSVQLAGLLHFAESLNWPNIDLITEDFALKLAIPDSSQDAEEKTSGLDKYLDPMTPTSPSIYGTPLASPRSPASARNSYFGTPKKRPTVSRTNTQRSVQLNSSAALLSNLSDDSSSPIDIGGWLSRSYLTGLILPGEAISHFLISTLLENDKLAIGVLGDTANLYGGFIYAERSWWSKTCIVSRVLSCIDGSLECMGWLSVPHLPSTYVDGWATVDSKQLSPTKRPLLKDGDRLADMSAIIPGMDLSTVKPEDLVLPLDTSTPPLPSIRFTEWNLINNNPASDVDSLASTASLPEEHPSTATLTFASPTTTHTLTLAHDVSFISSFPCTPPTNPNARLLARTASKRIILARRNSHAFSPLSSHPPDSATAAPPRPSVDAETVLAAQQETRQAEEWLSSRNKALPAHPLHASYKYSIVSVAAVLEDGFTAPVWEEDEDGVVSVGEVLVLDARGEADLELLARAWCADRGMHAIIGRVGRSCIGCCVREARGLGVKVIVRV